MICPTIRILTFLSNYMPSGSIVKSEEIVIYAISKTDSPTTIVVNSQPYDTTKGCQCCERLPVNSLIELTLELLFGTRNEEELIKIYSPLVTTKKGVLLNKYNFKKHLEHSALEKMSDVDRKLLEINYKDNRLKEKVLEKLNGDFSLDTAQLDAIKKVIQLFTNTEGILASQRQELAELEAGKLPDIMKDTHETKDDQGNIVTDKLYPLVEKKRSQVKDTNKEIVAMAFHLAEVIQSTTKSSADPKTTVFVSEIWTHMQDVGQGLASYADFGVDLIREIYPDSDVLNARWLDGTKQYFETELLLPLRQIQKLLSAMLGNK
jgi:hypothetical protein